MTFSTIVYLKNCFDNPAMFLSLSPQYQYFRQSFCSFITPVTAIQNDEQITEDTDSEWYIPDFDNGAKKLPLLYPGFHDIDERDLLDDSLQKDIAWSLAEGIDEYTESQPEIFLGSWTCFKKDTSNLMFEKYIVEYLPIVPEPPEYPVCKKVLDDLLDIMKELDLDHIFVHADELVYSKSVHILWKFHDIYNLVIVLMGGFHQLRVRQKQIYKR